MINKQNLINKLNNAQGIFNHILNEPVNNNGYILKYKVFIKNNKDLKMIQTLD